jgi:hypothetical protein
MYTRELFQLELNLFVLGVAVVLLRRQHFENKL